MNSEPTIEFRLDRQSGVPAYRQLIDQVRHAIHLGILRPGDQLPTVRQVVKQITINPNTVHRAYMELELQGFTQGRAGSGTFVREFSDPPSNPQPKLLRQLQRWFESAEREGVSRDGIEALIAEAMNTYKREEKS